MTIAADVAANDTTYDFRRDRLRIYTSERPRDSLGRMASQTFLPGPSSAKKLLLNGPQGRVSVIGRQLASCATPR